MSDSVLPDWWTFLSDFSCCYVEVINLSYEWWFFIAFIGIFDTLFLRLFRWPIFPTTFLSRFFLYFLRLSFLVFSRFFPLSISHPFSQFLISLQYNYHPIPNSTKKAINLHFYDSCQTKSELCSKQISRFFIRGFNKKFDICSFPSKTKLIQVWELSSHIIISLCSIHSTSFSQASHFYVAFSKEMK